jgi:D-lactate dehydrogenase
MRVHIFSAQGIELEFLEANRELFAGVDVQHTLKRLTADTAALAAGSDAVICFVNDDLSRGVLQQLKNLHIGLVLLRCAGYDVRRARRRRAQATRAPGV